MLTLIQTTPNIKIEDILIVLAPIITWLAAFSANWIKAKLGKEGFNGMIAVSVVVPLASLIGGYVTKLIVPELNFWYLFLLSFVSTYINQFIKQYEQSRRNEQNSVEPTITTLPKKMKSKNC